MCGAGAISIARCPVGPANRPAPTRPRAARAGGAPGARSAPAATASRARTRRPEPCRRVPRRRQRRAEPAVQTRGGAHRLERRRGAARRWASCRAPTPARGRTRTDASARAACGRPSSAAGAGSRMRIPSARECRRGARPTRCRTSWGAATRSRRVTWAQRLGVCAPGRRVERERRVHAGHHAKQGGGGWPRGHDQRGRSEVTPDGRQRGQRHHGIAQPVRRQHHHRLRHRSHAPHRAKATARSGRLPARRRSRPPGTSHAPARRTSRRHASGGASTATAPGSAGRTSRARRCSAA